MKPTDVYLCHICGAWHTWDDAKSFNEDELHAALGDEFEPYSYEERLNASPAPDCPNA